MLCLFQVRSWAFWPLSLLCSHPYKRIPPAAEGGEKKLYFVSRDQGPSCRHNKREVFPVGLSKCQQAVLKLLFTRRSWLDLTLEATNLRFLNYKSNHITPPLCSLTYQSILLYPVPLLIRPHFLLLCFSCLFETVSVYSRSESGIQYIEKVSLSHPHLSAPGVLRLKPIVHVKTQLSSPRKLRDCFGGQSVNDHALEKHKFKLPTSWK